MRLWLLEATEAGRHHLTCDCSNGFVVREISAPAARKGASLAAGDEGAKFWTDPTMSTCIELKPEGTPGIILRDLSAG